MKGGRTVKLTLAVALALTLFAAGVLTGNFYQFLDFLCPASAQPHRLTEDLVSPEGITIPRGMVVPLRKCAYMQRFHWHFAIEKDVQLEAIDEISTRGSGFSLLTPRQQDDSQHRN